MKLVGIAIDNWKLPIFARRLTDSGFLFETVALDKEMLILKVKAETIAEVSRIVEAANAECEDQKGSQ